jgi:predicted transcriptional regulator
MHIDVLKVLAHKGPLKLTHIMYKANVNCSVLKEFLDFLTEQDLAEEKAKDTTRTVYAITDKGRRVLTYFRELKTMLPIDEEEPEKIPAQLL